MKVLVLGATGSIGFPVAQALVRAGHVVYGLARSEEKVRKLAVEEITPVLGDATTPTSWTPLIATLDVVIEAVQSSTDKKELSNSILDTVEEAAKTLRPVHAPKLTYIFTSGVDVHGDNRKDIVTDTTPLTSPSPSVVWRPALEQRVMKNVTVNGIVIRPTAVYGRSGSNTALLFKSAYAGKVGWYGSPSDRKSFIHCDDLADLYVRAAEKAQLVGGQAFDAANSFTESVDDVLRKLVEVSGAPGPHVYLQPTTPAQASLTTTMRLRPYLARSLLGWEPRRAGFVDNMEVYYNAWKSAL